MNLEWASQSLAHRAHKSHTLACEGVAIPGIDFCRIYVLAYKKYQNGLSNHRYFAVSPDGSGIGWGNGQKRMVGQTILVLNHVAYVDSTETNTKKIILAYRNN